MTSSGRVAAFLVRHSRALWLLSILIAGAAVAFICVGARLNSDVLDMLPRHFESVQVYKTWNREFALGRELMFGILDESGESDMEGFTEHFAAELKKQPWIVRVMQESPLASPSSLEELRAIALPLLLNLPTAEFEEVIKKLRPEAIETNLAKLHGEFAAGSPKAEFQLQNDPLGIVLPPLAILSETLNKNDDQPMKSEKQDLRVVMAVTNQVELKSPAYQAMAKDVEAFITSTTAAWEGPKPRVLFTGRTAYEGELSQKLQSDLLSTLGSTVVLVAGTFWLGFRRWKPLLAIFLALTFCCLIAVACGALIFHELNMITIGLCSILVGLGVDFAMMLYAIYMKGREEGLDHVTAITAALRAHGYGVLFGSLTTAASFLCLLRSDSAGFQQLGVLIACGIVVAALCTMTLFWVYLGKNVSPRGKSRISAVGGRFANWALDHPKLLTQCSLVLFGLLALVLVIPVGSVRFQMDPKSLEPKGSNAGKAMEIIRGKLDRRDVDPVLVLIEGHDASDFHAKWQKAHTVWLDLIKDNRISAVASPVAFAASPKHVQANASLLAGLDFETTTAALEQAIAREGFSPGAPAFEKTRGLITTLREIGAGNLELLNWRKTLPDSSAWWFIIDRFLSRNGLIGVAVIWPSGPVDGVQQARDLRELLAVPGTGAKVSGWTYTLAELRPWSGRKMAELTVYMIGMNILLLTYLFRRLLPVVIMFSGLLMSVAALFATLKLTGIELNLFNILAFPLVLGVGVDYGIYIALSFRSPDPRKEICGVMKPIFLSGITTVIGFGSLAWAQNPALCGLGLLCGIGVGWCLLATFIFVLPAMAWAQKRSPGSSAQEVVPPCE